MWYVFFFKQKTAYERRISDWSSDVCSSDLRRRAFRRVRSEAVEHRPGEHAQRVVTRAHHDDAVAGFRLDHEMRGRGLAIGDVERRGALGGEIGDDEIGRASGRERVGQYV